jgi:hypothetical protein
MAMTDELPKDVVDLMASGIVAEFATISQAGVPIDTVCLYFPSDGLKTIDLATGLSYPAKAERARKNPKVGLLIEGRRDEPVISIAGMAAVRDADPQANALRYIAETGYSIPGDAPWEIAHKAVYYWTRIIIEVTPARVLWWDNRDAMDRAPHRWEAPAGTVYSTSDPLPPGALSATPKWPPRVWQEAADHALTRKAAGHLTLIDPQGFPLPIRARKITLTDEGFDLDMPGGVPWSGEGKATLSFEGLETFLGEVRLEHGVSRMKVERALPFHPLMNDNREMWNPTPETYNGLMGRLKHETERRGVPIPTIPTIKPEPTAGARLRMARRAVAPPPRDAQSGRGSAPAEAN